MATTPLEASIQALLDVIRLLPQGIMSALGGRPVPTPGPGASAFAGQSQTVAAGFGQGAAALGVGTFTALFTPLQRLTREFGQFADILQRLRENAGHGVTLATIAGGTGALTTAQRTALAETAASPLLSPREQQRLQDLTRTAVVTQQRHQQAVRAYQGARQTLGRVQTQARRQYQQAVTIRDTAAQRHHEARRQQQRATALVGRRQRQLAGHQSTLASYQAMYRAAPTAANAADVAWARRQVQRATQALGTARGRRRVASRVFGQATQGLAAAQGRIGTVFRAGRSAIARAASAVTGARGTARTTGAATATARTALSTGGTGAAALVAGRAAAGAVGGGVTAAIELSKALQAAANAASQYAENVNTGNRALAGFSGKISTAFAQLDVHQFQRQFALARGTEDSAVRLTEAIDRLRQDQLRFQIAGQNILNNAGTVTASLGGGFASKTGESLNIVNQVLGDLGFGGDAIQEIARGIGTIVAWGNPTTILSEIAKLFGYQVKEAANFGLVPADHFALALAAGNANAIRQPGAPPLHMNPQIQRPRQMQPGRANPFGPIAPGGFGAGGVNAL